MKFTRPQLIAVTVMGILTVAVYVGLMGIVLQNVRYLAQQPGASSTGPAPVDQVGEAMASPTATATPTSTPAPTPTPTPPVPQTRYDLQIVSDPENAALRVQRGYAYIALGAYANAVADFDVAIGLDDALAAAYAGRAEAHFHLKEWTAALADLEMGLLRDPAMADAHALRGHLFSEWGRHAEALQALRRAIELDGSDPRKHIWLGQALLRSGLPEEAVVAYNTALSLDGRSVGAYVGRAMALAEQGEFVAAQGDLTMAQDLVPYDPVALNGQAWLWAWYQRTNLGEAERLAQRAVAGAEDDFERARYLYTQGWIYYQQGRYGEAATVLEEAATLATVEGAVVYGEIPELLADVREVQ